MSNRRLQKPGELAKRSKKYVEKGPRGGEVTNPRVVEVDRGEKLPPTREKERRWK